MSASRFGSFGASYVSGLLAGEGWAPLFSFFLMRVPSRLLSALGRARSTVPTPLGPDQLGRAQTLHFPPAPGMPRCGAQGDRPLAPKGTVLKEGVRLLRVQNRSHVRLSTGGPGKGCCQSREVGYLGGGRAIRLLRGFLPPAQLPIVLTLSDSPWCVAREGVVLRKRGSRQLVSLTGLAASAEKRRS